MRDTLTEMLQRVVKDLLYLFTILWQIVWAFMTFMCIIAVIVNSKGIDGPTVIGVFFTLFCLGLALIPVILKHRKQKKDGVKTFSWPKPLTQPKSPAQPVALDPALHGAKWKLLELVDSPERLSYYVGLHKRRVLQSEMPVTEIDICRFMRDAIIECREDSIGSKSQLLQLMRQGNAHLKRLEGNHGELLARIQTYSQDNETVPENLLSAQARLEASIEQLRADYSALVQEMRRLREHFDQFEGQIEFLNDTETDLILLQRIDQSLGQTEQFRGNLPEGQLQQSWEIGQRFYALARQTDDALSSLAVNLAVKEPTVDGMEAMLAQIVAKTSRIQNPFLHS